MAEYKNKPQVDVVKAAQEAYAKWQAGVAEAISGGDKVSEEDIEVLVSELGLDTVNKGVDGSVENMETTIELDGKEYDVCWEHDSAGEGKMDKFFQPVENGTAD